MLLPLSLFHLPLRLQSAYPLLALRTLHTLSASPFGCAVALLPLALPTCCSYSPAFTSVSLRYSLTSNPSTWPGRIGTVSSLTLARPRHSSPQLTSTLSMPSDFRFGTATARLSTAGSVFFVRSSTPSRSMPLHPPYHLHLPLHLAHPPRLLPPVLTCLLNPRLSQPFSSSRAEALLRTVLLPGFHLTLSCTSPHFLSHSRLLRSRTTSPVACAVGFTVTAPSRSLP